MLNGIQGIVFRLCSFWQVHLCTSSSELVATTSLILLLPKAFAHGAKPLVMAQESMRICTSDLSLFVGMVWSCRLSFPSQPKRSLLSCPTVSLPNMNSAVFSSRCFTYKGMWGPQLLFPQPCIVCCIPSPCRFITLGRAQCIPGTWAQEIVADNLSCCTWKGVIHSRISRSYPRDPCLVSATALCLPACWSNDSFRFFLPSKSLRIAARWKMWKANNAGKRVWDIWFVTFCSCAIWENLAE